MKVLFFMRSTFYVRNFESTLRLLAARGHEVEVAAEPHRLSNEILERLCRECPSIRHCLPPLLPSNDLSLLGLELRRGIDYLRYFTPAYAAADKLRARAAGMAPEFVTAALRRPMVATGLGRRALAAVLRGADRAVPRAAAIDAFLAERRPDVVLVTPLVAPGSPQSEFIRSARALGIRTGLCVYSWDNLTNKGLIHDPLDLVTVWNEAMKREAVTLHGVPPARVVVTGAAAYDHWFTWRPRLSREAFCARVGLPPDRPYLLYLCSSRFIAPNEVPHVRTWIERLRALSPALRRVGVLVRPHPQNTGPWEEADLSGLADVAIWPRAGANPIDDESRADYYDSIHHSAAVVGVNTSAQIESAIVGRGVYTLLSDEFRETQDGTLHFQHLRDANGGLLHLADSFEEHAAQLAAAVASPADDQRCRRFVERFVRPHGVDQPAAQCLVEAIEQLARSGPGVADRGPMAWLGHVSMRLWSPLARPLLVRAAARVAGTRRARKEKARAKEYKQLRQEFQLAARAADRERQKLAREDERRQRQHEAQARRDAARAATEQTIATAYAHYLDARDRLRPFSAAAPLPVALTPAERARAAALAHFWDATPETIGALRRHCAPISDVDAAEYDEVPGDLRQRLGREVRLLRVRQLGHLVVPEPRALGGFGAVRDGQLFNDDTVRHLKILVALHDAAVLGTFATQQRRGLVWEIGGGWGGFAHQFKTVCPNATYLITGAAEQLLLSSVYLRTLFPDARVRFFASELAGGGLWPGWETVDFVFAPESALAVLAPPPIALVLDVGAMRDMSGDRIDAHVSRAFDWEARYFYSVLPSDRVDDEASRVWTRIDRRYWLNPVPPRVEQVPPVVDVTGAPALESEWTHTVGWRRLSA